jgi:predicted ArsR family transcriptional regulator
MYARDVGAMAEKLRFERNVLQCHLDRLQETGLVETTGGNYLHGHVYWALIPEGRRYVVESKLI